MTVYIQYSDNEHDFCFYNDPCEIETDSLVNFDCVDGDTIIPDSCDEQEVSDLPNLAQISPKRLIEHFSNNTDNETNDNDDLAIRERCRGRPRGRGRSVSLGRAHGGQGRGRCNGANSGTKRHDNRAEWNTSWAHVPNNDPGPVNTLPIYNINHGVNLPSSF